MFKTFTLKFLHPCVRNKITYASISTISYYIMDDALNKTLPAWSMTMPKTKCGEIKYSATLVLSSSSNFITFNSVSRTVNIMTDDPSNEGT